MYSKDHFPFTVRPLPYPAKELQPFFDPRSVKVHHDWHYALHIERLNKLLEAFPKFHRLPLDALILKQAFLPQEIRGDVKYHAGGAFAHMLFFECLSNRLTNRPSNEFKEIIKENFSSFDKFSELIKKAALSIRGSGFVYLAADTGKKLHILALKDNETPIEHRLTPLLPIDMWEHAYYLKYQYHRIDYLNALLSVINWQRVEMNYVSA